MLDRSTKINLLKEPVVKAFAVAGQISNEDGGGEIINNEEQFKVRRHGDMCSLKVLGWRQPSRMLRLMGEQGCTMGLMDYLSNSGQLSGWRACLKPSDSHSAPVSETYWPQSPTPLSPIALLSKSPVQYQWFKSIKEGTRAELSFFEAAEVGDPASRSQAAVLGGCFSWSVEPGGTAGSLVPSGMKAGQSSATRGD
ncbi:mucosa-associated lymphoid tissue lymphoma translocation protein 1-like protein [Lates japonicus]|uniref:Mucosa-associated lymphoid tissue lymphoma translocation protein 1-like protein n=1 Tax=Lates japonicus TaxID=270547 RepID=A0AAD3MI11_LATJO|nr:mucosa-associated lymphoid tissue lymphoma translocation protein 1-like protein [Lates japonicus]